MYEHSPRSINLCFHIWSTRCKVAEKQGEEKVRWTNLLFIQVCTYTSQYPCFPVYYMATNHHPYSLRKLKLEGVFVFLLLAHFLTIPKISIRNKNENKDPRSSALENHLKLKNSGHGRKDYTSREWLSLWHL